MIVTAQNEQLCQEVLAKLDSYMDSDLALESQFELTHHLERCDHCSQEAERRRNMRRRLALAVRHISVPPDLKGRIRERLQGSNRPQSKYLHRLASAAAVLVFVGALAINRSGRTDQESYINAITQSLAPTMRVGLGNHLHCAVLKKRATRSAGAVTNLPARFKGLLSIAESHVPQGFRLISAHECRYHSRSFAHLTFGNSRTVLSLVIARRQAGETLAGGLESVAAARYQVAAFETREFLVYAISDLPARVNRDLLAALNPPFEALLNQIGA